MRPKHTLIAVTGMTPQVVTETLFGLLVQQRKAIEELFIITTAEGKRALMGNGLTGPLPPLADEIKRLCAMHSVNPPLFDPSIHVHVAREESVELHDIRSDRDNRLFPNLITDFIREKTNDPNTVLSCSIAGGRKTMSTAMAFALSLFGRKEDKLYHVLVSERFEKSRRFFPETAEEAQELVLTEVPYIRLREKLPLLREFPRASFTDYVAIAQGEIDKLITLAPLVFERRTCTVRIGEYVVRFRPFDFAFYLFVAQRKKPIQGGKHFSEKNWQRLKTLYESLAPSAGHRERVARTISRKYREDLLTKAGSNIRRTLKKVLGEEQAKWYAVTSLARYAEVHYAILLGRDKVIIR